MLNKDGKRELAYVDVVHDIVPIKGADNIELVHVEAWNLIARKGEFKEGDKCVFFEIDSRLPKEDARFEFMDKKGYKVKTMKLSKFGVFSEGLALPLSQFPEIPQDAEPHTFVTDLLKVTYYDPEDNVRKSDPVESRINSYIHKHKRFFDNKFVKFLMKFKFFRWLFLHNAKKKRVSEKDFPSQYVSKTDEERCLRGDVKILTDTGEVRIADIVKNKKNCFVLSYDEINHKLEYRKIISYQTYNKQEPIYKIGYNSSYYSNRIKYLYCTGDHPIYTTRGYIKAKDLTIQDSVFMPVLAYKEDSLSAIYGMLLGDSSFTALDKRTKSTTRRIQTSQGEKQLEYLKYKLAMFGDKYTDITPSVSGYCDNIVYHGTINLDYTISSLASKEWQLSDKDNKKHVTPAVIARLTPLSIALWYLDDGTLRHRNDGLSSNICISTCGFTKEENVLLSNCLRDRFGVTNHLTFEKHKYWSLYIPSDGVDVFMKIISPYVPACMSYKLKPEYVKSDINYPIFTKTNCLLPILVKNITTTKRQTSIVYDIEVESNHNFFANGVLTHNCQNMPSILQNKNPWVVTEKVDGTSSTYLLVRKPLGKFEFYVCSRNIRMLSPTQETFNKDDNIYWENALRYHIEDHLKEYLNEHKDIKWVCIQGESYGEGWQGNPLKIKGHNIAVFNFKDSKNGRWGSLEGKKLMEEWGIPWVPIIHEAYTLPDTVDELLEAATGPSTLNKDVLREGWVLRAPDGVMSFKAVSPEYLASKK